MNAGGPVELFVDLAALESLHASVRGLRDDLAALGQRAIHADADELGGGEVAGAVDRFVSGWRDGRQQIEENLYACALLLEQAIDAYTRAEAGLSGQEAP